MFSVTHSTEFVEVQAYMTTAKASDFVIVHDLRTGGQYKLQCVGQRSYYFRRPLLLVRRLISSSSSSSFKYKIIFI